MTRHLNFNKSDLVLLMSRKLQISESRTLLNIDHLILEMTTQVALDKNIEIRGFGVFRKKQRISMLAPPSVLFLHLIFRKPTIFWGG